MLRCLEIIRIICHIRGKEREDEEEGMFLSVKRESYSQHVRETKRWTTRSLGNGFGRFDEFYRVEGALKVGEGEGEDEAVEWSNRAAI